MGATLDILFLVEVEAARFSPNCRIRLWVMAQAHARNLRVIYASIFMRAAGVARIFYAQQRTLEVLGNPYGNDDQ